MDKRALEIKMDYSLAIRQADTLSQAGKELRKTAEQELEACASEIRGSWTGSSASAYLEKLEGTRGRMVKTARKMERTAQAIQRIAGNTYQAEMGALALARLRKYE